MVFSSILFLFAFLPVVLICYYAAPGKIKNAVLLLASLFFYAWGEPVYVVLMLFSVIFNYVIGLDIERAGENTGLCRFNLVFAIIVDLGLLFYFKYTGFALSIAHIPYEGLALPIGISFYTFQTLSYVIDVYKKTVKAQKNLLDFAVYVTMFPQLIAGPIVRYVDVEKQLKNRVISFSKLETGVEIFIKGLAKKVLLANNIGALATTIQGMEPSGRSAVTAWLGAFAYTLQIYFDFSGYSDMAIGLGKMLGFDFMKNFDYPYLSKSVTEFWRRWHISLGTWFREYVYIPLGGNRVPFWKHIRNILVVWFLTGLWHGASWNFVAWGMYYGILLLLEKYVFKTVLDYIPGVIKNLYTMILVVLGWVLFMSPSLGQALSYLESMFGANGHFLDGTALYYCRSYGFLFIICILSSGSFLYEAFKKMAGKHPVIATICNVGLLLGSVAYLVYDTYNPFLYFRF